MTMTSLPPARPTSAPRSMYLIATSCPVSLSSAKTTDPYDPLFRSLTCWQGEAANSGQASVEIASSCAKTKWLPGPPPAWRAVVGQQPSAAMPFDQGFGALAPINIESAPCWVPVGEDLA